MLRHSDSLSKLAPALVKAQAEVENAIKNKTNLHLGSDYANLEEVLRVVKPHLGANGLALLQAPGLDGQSVTLESMIVHESGEWIAFESGAPLPFGRTNKKGDPIPVTTLDVGAAATLLRRYSLAGLACITQADDDGQSSMGGAETQFLSDFQANEIRERIKKVGADEKRFLAFMKAAEIQYIPAAKYDDALRALEAKAQENGQAKKAAAR